MRKNAWVICCCTAVLAAFGTFFRWLQDQVCFEAETGLAVRGSIWPYAVALMIVIAAVVLAVVCFRMKNQPHTSFPDSLPAAFAAAPRVRTIGGIVLVGKNARVRYIEKHYGEGDGNGENVMNPTTIVDLGENSYMEMETTQIKGIDSTYRDTQAHLSDGATLIIKEKIMTHGHQHAETNFSVDLDGYDSSTNVISRSVAKDHSSQMFNSNIRGNNKCAGHSECDAIIMDEGTVGARPEITANSVEASLIHEAAIGKIAGEQLNKLMTLGLTEKEAEEQIISGFLK